MSDSPNRGGRPPHSPRPEQRQMVQVLKANGIDDRTIARQLSIDRNTLRKHYREELNHGFDQVHAAMGAALVKAGLSGNVGAQTYWLKTRGGQEWREVQEQRHGLTPDAKSQGLTAPVLFIQPVASANSIKPNGHDKPLPPDMADAEDQAPLEH